MTSKNGYLTPAELTTVQGDMQLRNDTARAWNAMKAAAAKDGVTLTIARPEGDYRTWATQLDMRAHPAKYNITPGVISGLPSEHGFGTCVDVASGLAWVKEHGGDFGFTFPLAKTDPNHARYDGVTIPAGETGSLITEDAWNEGAQEMNYRLFSLTNSIAADKRAASNPDGVTLALGEMDPRWNKGGRNVWVEAPLDQVRDWVNFWGPAKELDVDIWKARSNAPGRLSAFPVDAAVAITDAQLKAIGASVSAGASPADVAAAVKAGADAVIAHIPTKLTV